MLTTRPACCAGLALVIALACGLLVPSHAQAETTFLHTAPETAPMRRPLIVGGQLSDSSGVDRLVLFYRTGWNSWRQLKLQFDPPDTYVIAIPADDLTPPDPAFDHGYIDYYVVAFAASGARTYVFASPTEPVRVKLKSVGRELDDDWTRGADSVSRPKKEDPDAAFDNVPREAPAARPKRISPSELSALAPEVVLPPKPEAPTPVVVAKPRESLTFSLNAERIRQLGLRTMVDVAQLLPGISVSRDTQGFWRLTRRGRESDAEIVVLVDGQRVNNPLDGKVDWELPLIDVERVEVRAVPDVPVEYGPAFAVISVTSTQREVIGGGGYIGTYAKPLDFANDSYGGHFLGSHTWGAVRVSGGADFAMRAGYLKTIGTDGILRDGVAGQTDDERIGGVARLRLDYAFKGGSSVWGQLRASHEQRSTLIGAVDVLEPESKLVGDVGLAQLGGHVVYGTWEFDARLFADDQLTDRNLALFPAEAFVKPLTLPAGLFLRTRASVLSMGLSFATGKTFGPLDTLRFGADLQRQGITQFGEGTTPASEISVTYRLPGGVTYPEQVPDWATRWLGGIFAENVWKPLKILSLTTGVRGDVASGLGRTLFLPSGRAILALRVAPFLSLHAGGSRTTRLPTFDELLSVVPLSTLLNDGLPSGFNPASLTRPVTLTAAELGMDSVVGPEDNRVVLRASGFYDLYDDPIEVIDEGQGFRIANRSPGEQCVGAEGEVRYDWRKIISVFANISWVLGQDRALADAAPAFSFLTEAPALRANGGLIIPIANVLSLATTVTYGSERRSDTRSVVEVQRDWSIPAYMLLSGTLKSAPIGGWFEIAVSIYSVKLMGRELDPVLRPDRLPGLLPREGVNGSFTLMAVY